MATLGINDRARALDETDILNVGIESRMPFGIVGLHMYTFVFVLVNLLLPDGADRSFTWFGVKIITRKKAKWPPAEMLDLLRVMAAV